MPREAFSCIFKQKEQPVKGTPDSTSMPAVGLQPAEISLFSLRYFRETLPISFP